MRASAVGLNVDLLALAKTPGEFSAGEINFQDSSLSIFEAGDLVTTIEGVDGEIFASQESIRVDRISALLGGWQVTLRGIVTLPQETADPGESIAPALDANAPSAPVVLDSALAAATGLTDKAITFAGKGPLSDPAVTLKAFPIEFASASLGNILGTSPRSLETLRIVTGVEEAVGAFADELGEPGITIHPEVIMFFKTLLGEEAPAPEAPAEPQAE